MPIFASAPCFANMNRGHSGWLARWNVSTFKEIFS